MRISFADESLRRCFDDPSNAVRQWGVEVGRKYLQRVEILLVARTLRDLSVPRSWHFHPLKGQRDGQYAISLNERWRLIFTYDSETETLSIKEVTNHYDD